MNWKFNHCFCFQGRVALHWICRWTSFYSGFISNNNRGTAGGCVENALYSVLQCPRCESLSLCPGGLSAPLPVPHVPLQGCAELWHCTPAGPSLSPVSRSIQIPGDECLGDICCCSSRCLGPCTSENLCLFQRAHPENSLTTRFLLFH